MAKILISAPSLDVKKNVSGVSSVVLQIRRVVSPDFEFSHLEIGSEQKGHKVRRLCSSLWKTALAAYVLSVSNYDLLHSNTALNPKSIIRDLVMCALARLRGKGILLHVHGGAYVHEQAPKLMNAALKLLLGLADKIVVLSRQEKSFLTERFPTISSTIDFIYNGVDLSGAYSTIGEKKLSSLGQLKVAFVGRFALEKGLTQLLAACRSLNDSDNITVDFFGDGEMLPALLTLAQETPLVTYQGVFLPSDSRKVLGGFDALVLPSLRGEGMPMAVIEAMSVGVTPICSPISSIPEIITDGETGLLTQIGSSRAIVDALRRLQRDPVLRRRTGRAAYDFASINFDAVKNYGRLKEIYRKILSGA